MEENKDAPLAPRSVGVQLYERAAEIVGRERLLSGARGTLWGFAKHQLIFRKVDPAVEGRRVDILALNTYGESKCGP